MIHKWVGYVSKEHMYIFMVHITIMDSIHMTEGQLGKWTLIMTFILNGYGASKCVSK